MFDFSISSEDLKLQRRTREFIKTKVIPYERDARWTDHGPTDGLREELNALARQAGLLAPQVAADLGGMGLSHIQRAIVFEASGYSMLGPIAMHCAAPDEGNLHLLEVVANPSQRERYLRPMAQAESRSCFAMTEPNGGAGSDPAQLATRADLDGDHFVINGDKWLITGAEGAKVIIVMARAFDGDKELGPTMFLAPMPNPAIQIVRLLDTMDSSFTGGHGELHIRNLRVHRDDVLGEVGRGLQYAQVRLAPARLTHCMRWLGSAVRAQEIALDYAAGRQAFGRPLVEHGSMGAMLADNEIDIHTSRLAIQHAAWMLDQGENGRHVSSMVKVFVSESLFRVADRCMQVLGGMGITRDTQVERIFREIRTFRIYDGPSEVHRWAIAKRITPKGVAK